MRRKKIYVIFGKVKSVKSDNEEKFIRNFSNLIIWCKERGILYKVREGKAFTKKALVGKVRRTNRFFLPLVNDR